jgi:hypothetical protein
LETKPQTLERESLRLYVEKKLRVIESELLRLAHKYGVQNVNELDEMIKQGKYHEDVAVIGVKLRIILTDTSYVDVWVSRKLENRFGFHWGCNSGIS